MTELERTLLAHHTRPTQGRDLFRCRPAGPHGVGERGPPAGAPAAARRSCSATRRPTSSATMPCRACGAGLRRDRFHHPLRRQRHVPDPGELPARHGTDGDHLGRDRYERVVFVGNSGGASIVPYYQAQAVAPSVTTPPGGGPDLTGAGLGPVDAVVMLNAHPSRSVLSTEWLDPAIHDEYRPFDPTRARHVGPDNGPPYSSDFVAALPRRPVRSKPPDRGLGRGPLTGWAHPATRRSGSTTSPSWCRAPPPTSVSSTAPSTRATGWSWCCSGRRRSSPLPAG